MRQRDINIAAQRELFQQLQTTRNNTKHLLTDHLTNMSKNSIMAMVTKLVGIKFQRKSMVIQGKVVTNTELYVSNVAILAILGAINIKWDSALKYFGSFMGNLRGKPGAAAQVDPVQNEFFLALTNLGCTTIDLSEGLKNLTNLAWSDDDGPLEAVVTLYDQLSSEDFVTVLEFRQKLPSCESLNQQTLLMLNKPPIDDRVRNLLDINFP